MEVTQSISTHLLANRELLSLNRARTYLATRVRTQTPLGAAEFLTVSRHHGREAYGKRIKVALDCVEIYREAFPGEYARSSSTYLSRQQEHEFYWLVHTRLFPLIVDEETDLLTYLEREPNFVLPFIPLRGIQQHHWFNGRCDCGEDLQLVFRLCQTLAQQGKPKDRLPIDAEVASPLAAVGWMLFENACYVQDSPLRFFPFAFRMMGYDTGNPWLDLPSVGTAAYPWSSETIAEMAVMYENAHTMIVVVNNLNTWLEEDPAERIGRVVEIWNAAARKEEETGYGGMLVDDLVQEAGGMPLGPDRVMLPGFRPQLEGIA